MTTTSLYRADRDRGLEILGFPCNQPPVPPADITADLENYL